MKAPWFMPLTFAGGAEGFALFAPYLIAVLSVLYFARVYGEARRTAPAGAPREAEALGFDTLPAAQPAL